MTLGNDDKRHFAVLSDGAKQKAYSSAPLKLDGSPKQKLPPIIENESAITNPDMLQQLIMQKQALLVPLEVPESKIDSAEKFLNCINTSFYQAEERLEHDLSTIFSDFEKYAYKHQKYAVCKINGIIDKTYADNYHNCIDEFQSVLNGSLQYGISEVMAPLYIDMHDFIESKSNHIFQCFIGCAEDLVQKIYQTLVDLLELQRNIKITIPMIQNQIPPYSDSSGGTFTESSAGLPAGSLPDSFVFPILLKEIKMRIPLEIEKRFHDFNLYCWDYLQKTALYLKNRMRSMVEEAEKQLKSVLNNKADIKAENHETLI